MTGPPSFLLPLPPGYIRLELPVFHVGFFRFVLLLCQCMCKACSRILLNQEEQGKFRK